MPPLNGSAIPPQEGAEVPIASKLFSECHSCRKCQALHGVALLKCAGCGVVLYCSKECQRAAWPRHREDCKTQQTFRSTIGSRQNTALDTLISFVSKLAGPISKFGLQAFDLNRYPTRGLHDILFIGLLPRPGARSVRLSYTVGFLHVRPIAELATGAIRQKIREVIRLGVEENRERKLGGLNGVVILLTDITTGVCMVKSVAFYDREGLSSPSWKEDLVYHIENGIDF